MIRGPIKLAPRAHVSHVPLPTGSPPACSPLTSTQLLFNSWKFCALEIPREDKRSLGRSQDETRNLSGKTFLPALCGGPGLLGGEKAGLG